MTDMDWTRLVMASLYGAGLDTSSNGTCHDAVVAALRKAKADGMRESAEIAARWKSSLRPGNEHRLWGHNEAALSICFELREAADKLDPPTD